MPRQEGLLRHVDGTPLRHVAHVLPGSQVDVDADDPHAAVRQADLHDLFVLAVCLVETQAAVRCKAATEQC